jgi:hypothetical protein
MKFLLTFILILNGLALIAQNNLNDINVNIFKCHKQYITDSITQKYKSNYLAILHFSNVTRSKVINEINKIDSTFWIGSINILENFSSYTNVKGWLWKDNATIFTFSYNTDKKLTVQLQAISDLNNPEKSIIENWNISTLPISSLLLKSPTDSPLYWTTRLSSTQTQTAAFYY